MNDIIWGFVIAALLYRSAREIIFYVRVHNCKRLVKQCHDKLG